MSAVEVGRKSDLELYRSAERRLLSEYGLEAREHIVELSNPAIRIRIAEVGAGQPTLFLSGSGGTGGYWAPLLSELRNRRCLLLDRPGWGLSSPVDYRTVTLPDLAASVVEGTLDALEVPVADVVGSSIGNVWALHHARRHPARVRQIALLGGFPNPGSPLPRFIRLLASPLGAVMVRMPATEGMLRSQLRGLGHEQSLDAGRMSPFIEWRLAFQRHTPSMKNERAMVQALAEKGHIAARSLVGPMELAEIDRPIALIVGREDPVGSLDQWQEFIGHGQDARLTVIDNAGHMPWWDSPAEVANAIGPSRAAL